MGPVGRSSVGLTAPGCGANAVKEAIATANSITHRCTGRRRSGAASLCDMDLHLIDGVVEIAAGIPDRSCGLSSSLRVGGAGEDGAVACLRLPVISPEAPSIVGLFMAEAGGIPACAPVGGPLAFGVVRSPP